MPLIGKITFGDHLADIYSGDNVNLVIEIESQEEVFITEMFVNFSGEMNCHYDDLVNKNIDGEVVYVMEVFQDRETLIDINFTIRSMERLNKGKYMYNVVLKIPQQLPESVSWRYGSVRYELKLGFYGARGAEVLYKMPVNVKRYVNICLEENYMQPFHTVFKKFFCWGICSIRPIKIIITLPKTCLLPGDSFNYLIKIENFNKLGHLKQISIVLTQTQHYKVLKPAKRMKRVHTTLKQIKHHFGQNHRNCKLQGLFLMPKNLIPASPMWCFLNASYNLHFILVFSGLHTDGFVSVPLTIGSHRNNLNQMPDFTNDNTVLEIGGGDKRTEYEV